MAFASPPALQDGFGSASEHSAWLFLPASYPLPQLESTKKRERTKQNERNKVRQADQSIAGAERRQPVAAGGISALHSDQDVVEPVRL